MDIKQLLPQFPQLANQDRPAIDPAGSLSIRLNGTLHQQLTILIRVNVLLVKPR